MFQRKLVILQKQSLLPLAWPCLYIRPKFISTPSKTLIPLARPQSLSRQITFQTSEKPDAIIKFFTGNLGLSESQSLRILQSLPRLLRTDPAKHLSHKIDFLNSKGFSPSDIRAIVTGYPSILARSLNREIIPSFQFFHDLFPSHHRFMKTVVRYSGILCDLTTYSALNIQHLKEGGVPESIIVRFIEYFPRTIKATPKRFKETMQEVKEMGFSPLKLNFVKAVQTKLCLSRSTWERKEGLYRKWGWTDDDVFVAFRLHPLCMSASEGKIESVMGFLVNEMGFEASDVARCPVVLSFSLGKRIVPRGSVVLVLKSKGIMKQVSLSAIFKSDEKLFLDKFIYCHDGKEAEELLKLYKGKMTIAGG